MINFYDKYAMFDNGTYEKLHDEFGNLKEVFFDDWGNVYMDHYVTVEKNKCTFTVKRRDRIKYTFNEEIKNERV